MSNFDRNFTTARGVGADRALAIDAGLRAHMIRVYNYMAGGVALTGIVSWLTYQMTLQNPALQQALFGSPLAFVVMLAPLGLVMYISFRIDKIQPATARLLFFIYAGLLGISLASIFMVYTGASISRVFFISAAMFGAVSLYGYTTQRDLTGMGSFLMMGLIGLVIASLVNIFLKSSGLDWALSVLGVLIFTGLTAYDTQKIKEYYSPYDDGTIGGRKAVMGALSLYLDFINMFLMMLRLFGDRR